MAFLSLLCVAIQSCALGGSSKNYANQCRLDESQSATLFAKWPILPVPIAFADGDFSPDEMRKMAQAFKTWNDFYRSVKGEPLFDFGSVTSPNVQSLTRPTVTCASTIFENGAYTGPVGIFKVTSNWDVDDEIIALTSFCPNPNGRLGEIYMAMMEFNFENFFNSGQRQPDLQTVTTHEAGHLLGMGHSCEVFQAPGVPSCEDPNTPDDFIEALLFPIIFFPNGVNGEVRPNLQTNDQERSLCLFDSEFNAEGQ